MIFTPHLVNSWAPVWALFLPLILWFYMICILSCFVFILSFYLRFFLFDMWKGLSEKLFCVIFDVHLCIFCRFCCGFSVFICTFSLYGIWCLGCGESWRFCIGGLAPSSQHFNRKRQMLCDWSRNCGFSVFICKIVILHLEFS